MTETTGAGHPVAASRARDLVANSRRPIMTAPPANSISLSMGEPDLPTPGSIVEACVTALRSGETHYVDQRGLPELRTALAHRLTQRAEGTFTPEQVLVTHGATAALAAVMLAHIDPGDVVVIPQPAYSLYEDVVTLAGGISRMVSLGDDLHWDLAALERALVGAKMVVFANPSNPTGMVHTPEELQALASIAQQSGTLVVADEAYDRIVFDGREFSSALSVVGLGSRALYVQTFSKTYAMTGWRLGYVAGPSDLLDPVARVHATMNGSCNAFVQRAALTALQVEDVVLDAMTAEYERKRDALVARLAACEFLTVRRPEGAFYALIGFRHARDSARVSQDLAERGVLVRAGSEYGPSGEGFIRISFATSLERLERAVPIITSYFDDSAAAGGGADPA